MKIKLNVRMNEQLAGKEEQINKAIALALFQNDPDALMKAIQGDLPHAHAEPPICPADGEVADDMFKGLTAPVDEARRQVFAMLGLEEFVDKHPDDPKYQALYKSLNAQDPDREHETTQHHDAARDIDQTQANQEIPEEQQRLHIEDPRRRIFIDDGRKSYRVDEVDGEHLTRLFKASRKSTDPIDKWNCAVIAKYVRDIREKGDIEKGLGDRKPGAKYLRREGTPGNYKYIYEEPQDKKPAAEKPQEDGASEKKEPRKTKYIAKKWHAGMKKYLYLYAWSRPYGWDDMDIIDQIRSNGGLRPYKVNDLTGKRPEWEEFDESVPLFLRSKTGKPMDEMAEILGMDEKQLIKEIGNTLESRRRELEAAIEAKEKDQEWSEMKEAHKDSAEPAPAQKEEAKADTAAAAPEDDDIPLWARDFAKEAEQIPEPDDAVGQEDENLPDWVTQDVI